MTVMISRITQGPADGVRCVSPEIRRRSTEGLGEGGTPCGSDGEGEAMLLSVILRRKTSFPGRCGNHRRVPGTSGGKGQLTKVGLHRQCAPCIHDLAISGKSELALRENAFSKAKRQKCRTRR